MNILYFSQLYYQGMWTSDNKSPLYQLPYMSDALVTRVQKKLKKVELLKDILGSPEYIDKVLSCYEDEAHLRAAKDYIQYLPNMEFKVEVFVDEEGARNPKIHAGDIITLEISITDKAVRGEKAHYFMSQTFPYLKYINWHIFILGRSKSGQNTIMDFRMVGSA
jgi:hypothetical protein